MTVSQQSNPQWLMIVFSLPTRLASQRVEIWRKLQKYGTLPLSSAGYVLPNSPANLERMHFWGINNATTLARGLRAALDFTSSAK